MELGAVEKAAARHCWRKYRSQLTPALPKNAPELSTDGRSACGAQVERYGGVGKLVPWGVAGVCDNAFRKSPARLGRPLPAWGARKPPRAVGRERAEKIWGRGFRSSIPTCKFPNFENAQPHFAHRALRPPPVQIFF